MLCESATCQTALAPAVRQCPLTLVMFCVHVQVQRLIAVITKSQELQPQEVDKANLRRATHTLAELSKSGEAGLWAALSSMSIESPKPLTTPNAMQQQHLREQLTLSTT